MISKRALLLGLGIAPLSLLPCASARADDTFAPVPATGADLAREKALPPDAPVLYMVSAPDCKLCAAWNSQTLPGFSASAERARLRFVHLHSTSFRVGSGRDETWPADLRWIRDALNQDQVYMGTPLWALVRRHEYLAGASGLADWTKDMWPAIRSATGTA